MTFFITFLIFLIVLFFYVHLMDQYKTSDDLEILEMDYENNYQLQKTCNYKQPFIFQLQPIYNKFFENVTVPRSEEHTSELQSH